MQHHFITYFPPFIRPRDARDVRLIFKSAMKLRRDVRLAAWFVPSYQYQYSFPVTCQCRARPTDMSRWHSAAALGVAALAAWSSTVGDAAFVSCTAGGDLLARCLPRRLHLLSARRARGPIMRWRPHLPRQAHDHPWPLLAKPAQRFAKGVDRSAPVEVQRPLTNRQQLTKLLRPDLSRVSAQLTMAKCIIGGVAGEAGGCCSQTQSA